MNSMNCPHCGQALSANFAPGQLVQCPYCQSTFASTGPQPGAYAPPPPPPMAYGQGGGYSPGAYAPKRGNGFAVASLACGILCLAPLSLIFGIVGIVKSKDPRVGGRGMAIAGLILTFAMPMLVALPISILLPSLNKARGMANQIKCAANMRMIHNSMMAYAVDDRRGQLPDRVGRLLVGAYLSSSDVFVCPGTTDTMASGATPDQIMVNLESGGHDSYIYLGAGKSSRTMSPRVVLLYEAMGHHQKGFNACFGDGRVSFIDGPNAAKVYSELQAGQNPPPSYRGF